MKQKVIARLIVTALIASHLTTVAAGQTTATVDEIKTRAAEAQTKGKEVVVKIRAGAKVGVGKMGFPFEFLRSGSLRGRITELRAQDFIFTEKDDHKSEFTSILKYADVLSIKHESGFKRTLHSVGRYSLGVGAIPIFLPLYGVLAVLGRLPEC